MRPGNCSSTSRLLLLGAVGISLSGCAGWPPAPEAAEPANTPKSVQQSWRGSQSDRYLVVQGDQVELSAVTDDGTYTIFHFRRPPNDLQLFDQDGKRLAHATLEATAGVRGIYKGILIKRGASNGFVTPNPRTLTTRGSDLSSDPQAMAVVKELEAQAVAVPAFRRALELAERPAAPTGTNSIVVTPVALGERAAAAPLRDRYPTVVDTPSGRVYRVFFASGGRAVVAPDDGLQGIEQDALRAKAVTITGYTDAVGGLEPNTSLARARAETIRNYLVRRGVDPTRIRVSWAANAAYLGDNTTEQGRALNRRAEIVVELPEGSSAAG